MTVQTESKTDVESRCTLFVPKDLDLDLIPKRLQHESILLCSLIHSKWLNWQADKDSWAHLKSQHLRNLINDRKLYLVINKLLELKVIERNNSYQPGKRSKAYRLHPRYRACRTITINNKKMKQRLAKLECPKSPVHMYLEKQLQNLAIDIKRAARVIDRLKPDSDCQLTTKEYRQLVWEQCRVFKQRDLHLSRDPYGRCHSPFTRLPRKLRPCLMFRGEELAGFDLANSQPLFAGILSVIYHMGQADRLRNQKFDRKSNDTASWHLEEIKLRHIYRGLDGGSSIECNSNEYSKDLSRYLQLCQKGRFYESFGKNRDTIKKTMMSVLAGPTWYMKNSKVSEEFQERFPTVHAVLSDLKTNNHLPQKHPYKHVSHLLQNLEACMMIGCICSTAMENNIPVITLHDGLYTCQKHYDTLLSIAKKEFSRIGVKPTLNPTQ